jgi:hypothetical protein
MLHRGETLAERDFSARAIPDRGRETTTAPEGAVAQQSTGL